MSKYMEFEKMRDFAAIISDSITFFMGHIKALLRPLLLIGGIFLLGLVASSLVQQLKVFGMFAWATGTSLQQVQLTAGMFTVEYVMVILFSFFSYCTFSLVTLAYMAIYKEKGGQKPSMEELWAFYKEHAFTYYVAGLLLLLVLLVASLLLIIPGIYLFPVLSLVFPVMVFERVGLDDAFGRAFKLIHHNWWTTFGALVTIGIVIMVASVIISLPVSALLLAAPFIGDFQHLPVVAAVYTALMQPLIYFLYTLPVIVTALCYFSYREEKDGTGLLRRMESFGKTDTIADKGGLEQY